MNGNGILWSMAFGWTHTSDLVRLRDQSPKVCPDDNSWGWYHNPTNQNKNWQHLAIEWNPVNKEWCGDTDHAQKRYTAQNPTIYWNDVLYVESKHQKSLVFKKRFSLRYSMAWMEILSLFLPDPMQSRENAGVQSISMLGAPTTCTRHLQYSSHTQLQNEQIEPVPLELVLVLNPRKLTDVAMKHTLILFYSWCCACVVLLGTGNYPSHALSGSMTNL